MGRKWTDEEIQFLKFAYPNKDFTVKEISEGLYIPENKVRAMASKLGIERHKEIVPKGYQRCRRCKELLPLEHFSKSKRHKTGIDTLCKTCDKERKVKLRTQELQTKALRIQEKRCNRCGQIKPISEFNKNKNMKDGYLNQCKICKNEKCEEIKIKHLKERGW